MQLYLIIYFWKDLHVSDGSSAHHQERITVRSASDIVSQYCCRLVSRMRWNWLRLLQSGRDLWGACAVGCELCSHPTTEPEGSLPHSQAYATCLYPGPAQSSPYTQSHLRQIHPNIHPSTPRSTQWSLSFRFPHQDLIHPHSPHPYAPHAQPISFFSILSPAQYWVSSTNHLAPRYAISRSCSAPYN